MRRTIVFILFSIFSIHCFSQNDEIQNALFKINEYINAGKIDEAEKCFAEYRANLDSMTDDMYYSIINIAKFSQNNNFDVELTVSSITRVIEVFSQNRDVIESNQALIYYFQTYISFLCQINNPQYRKAYNVFKDLWPTIIEDYSQAYTNILEYVSLQEYKNNNCREALAIFEEILDLIEKGYSFGAPKYLYLGLVGYCHFKMNDSSKAVYYLDNAMSLIPNKDKTDNNENYYTVLRYSFEVAIRLSQINKSKELGKELIRHYEKAGLISDFISVSIKLANLLFSAFNDSEGIPLYEQSLKHILDSEDYSYEEKKQVLTNLYTLYNTCNIKDVDRKYKRERDEYKISLTKIESKIVDEFYVDSLINVVNSQTPKSITNIKQYSRDIQVIARYYSSRKKEKFAIELLEKTIQMFRDNGAFEQDYARLYNTLGSIYSNIQNYEKGKEYHHKVQSIYSNNSLYDAEYIDILCNLSNDCRLLGDVLLSKIYLDEAYRVSQSKSSGITADKDTYYNLLNNLSWLYQSLNNEEKALMYNQMIIDDLDRENKQFIYKKATLISRINILLYFDHAKEAARIIEKIGADYIDEHNCWGTSFNVKFFSEDTTIENDLCEIEQDNREEIARLYTTVSSDNLYDYWDVTGGNLNSYYSMALNKFNTPSLRKATYNNLLFTKTFQLEISKFQRNKKGGILSKKEINNIESRISDVDKIRLNLEENDIAIEFFISHYRPSFRKISKKYGALIMRKDLLTPIYVELCDMDSLGSIVYSNTSGEAISYANKYYDLSNTEIYKMIWKPLEKEIKEDSNIYISGSGATLFINFSALSNGTKRLGEIYKIHNIFSTSTIGNIENNNKLQTATIYGGIDYNTSLDVMEDEASNYTHYKTFGDYAMYRGIDERGGWGNLKYSLIEVDSIEKILNDGHVLVTKYVKTKASEESFKALSGMSPDLIHISTHGYYYQPYSHSFRSDYNNTYFSLEDNKLKYNGLLFSGANNAWKNNQYKENVDDGVLTAEEISLLDLSHTSLVTLSACQTGLGEVNDIDGNNGLLRAFKIAGVKDIIITLWNVSDRATSYFMESFYNNLFESNEAKIALDKTVEQIKKEMPDPYYWAPFVIIE